MTIRAPVILPAAKRKQSDCGFVSSNLLLTVLAVASVAVPFKQREWTNPRLVPRAWQAPSSSPNLLVTTLAPAAVASPFKQTDWQRPNSRSVQQPDVWPNFLATVPVVAASPFRQSDWTGNVRPYVKQVDLHQNLLSTTLAPVLASPFKPNTWINQQGQKGTRFFDLNPGLQQTTLAPSVAVPFIQSSWFVPSLRVFYQDYSWIQNLHQTTLAGGLSVLANHRGFLRNVGKLLSG